MVGFCFIFFSLWDCPWLWNSFTELYFARNVSGFCFSYVCCWPNFCLLLLLEEGDEEEDDENEEKPPTCGCRCIFVLLNLPARLLCVLQTTKTNKEKKQQDDDDERKKGHSHLPLSTPWIDVAPRPSYQQLVGIPSTRGHWWRAALRPNPPKEGRPARRLWEEPGWPSGRALGVPKAKGAGLRLRLCADAVCGVCVWRRWLVAAFGAPWMPFAFGGSLSSLLRSFVGMAAQWVECVVAPITEKKNKLHTHTHTASSEQVKKFRPPKFLLRLFFWRGRLLAARIVQFRQCEISGYFQRKKEEELSWCVCQCACECVRHLQGKPVVCRPQPTKNKHFCYLKIFRSIRIFFE